MFANYLEIAFRSLLKFRAYSAINLFGLSLGLMAGVMILIYVLDELSFDNFHVNKDRIYRVETSFFSNSGSEDASANETNGWAVGTTLRGMPEVEAVAYLRSASGLLVNHEGKHIREQMHFASPEFLQIFSFPLIHGNPQKALDEPYTMVVTQRMAEKYFSTSDVLNKTLTLGDTMNFVITGVMKNIPSNSHIQLDAVISFSTFTSAINRGFDYNGGWGNINVRNYLLLKPGVDLPSFREKARNIYMDRAGKELKHWGVEAYVHLAPLPSLYLTSKSGNGMGPLGSIQRIYMVSGIAFFVILLACINFINLTTARSVYRAKEVGLRKVVGSTRYALVRQFLSESFTLTVIALFFGLTLTSLTLPLFNQILGKTYTISSIFTLPVAVGIGALTVLISLLSGYYPALVMSAMRPSEVLKGKFQSGSTGTKLRKSLVVFQFVISTALVLATLVVIDQLRFMQQQDLGFAKDEIVVVNAARAKASRPEGYEAFRNELKQLTVIDDVTYTNALPGFSGWMGQVSFPEGRPPEEGISVEYMAVDENYISTLGLSLIAGDEFSEAAKSMWEEGLILNETAVSMYGWSSAEEAVGKKIDSPSGYPKGTVIGVVKDFHQFGLQQNIGPMVMDHNPRSSYLYAVRFKAANTKDLLQRLETKWKEHFAGYDFEYFFLDQEFEKQYQAEEKLATVFGVFAFITILIAVIGLLGLVSFMVASRTKEIGVRKVLGAGVGQITVLLSREFVVLVLLANFIAIPLIWYLANEWLANFATRVELRPLIFVAALFFGLIVTIVTISVQTVRAALADPVTSLRYE
jgi:putative ABC transport system permease protein